MYNQSVLTNATSLAARMGIAQGSPPLTSGEIILVAKDYCNANLMMTNLLPPIVNVIQTTQPNFQSPLQVTASYTYKGFFLGSILSALPSTSQFTSTTVMYQE